MNLPAHQHPVLGLFHPAVATWFRQRFATVTEAQAGAWPLIHAGQSMLLAAPTGSGKTLSAFLAVLDELLRQGLEHGGELPAQTQVVYVSPLKALSNDIRLNLEAPLEGIRQQVEQLGLKAPRITTAVRTGDTPQKERTAMRKLAPHILVTTPESLYVLMGSASGREGLACVHTVIVDEIHALADNKRGSHLALTLERLEALAGRPLRRIGLSATQRPVERVAQFLVGHQRPCAIVDIGHARQRDLALEVPPVPLGAVMATDVWALVYERLAALARQHRTTLIFVNTRRLAERLTRHLGERLGNDAVAAHHGSLAKEHRLKAEQQLKAGELQVLVSTASLELGIDIGDVDLVCQIASPGSIAAFLQRVGRSGHQVDGVPKGRLFPTSRDELIECVALLDCVRRGELDELHIPAAPLDVLAQQIVAEVSNQPWDERALFNLLRKASPYATLDEHHYQALLRMLADGFNGRQGVRSAYLHRDAVSASLRGRRGSQLTALTSGGTIPETADYAVLLEPQALNIGSVNEDFAIESIAGDIFQLGNASYRILRVEPGRVRVEDARGQPPTIPFWIGEAPGRSDELSAAVARLQARLDEQLQGGDFDQALVWLRTTYQLDEGCAQQLLDYLGRTWQVLGALPSQQTLVMERFFDESGGTQLIIHSPYGSRINRAWGLALRKRFCRTFNFELQAAASEDAIVLSLSSSHSFELDEVWRYLNSRTAEPILVQALLDAPLFGVRWRWCAAVAMALPRYVGGRKVPPQIQRMKSEDLIAAVFPDQIACLENLVGERQIPDHPLVEQTLDDCLHQAMDSEGWLALLQRMEAGGIRLLSRDLPAPSPLASAILNARPYTFLDDAPLEERRTQAVLNRRWNEVHSSDDLGALDPDAISAVQAEAWPHATNADELHEALMSLGVITQAEADANPGWIALLGQLAQAGRACRLQAGGQPLWLARERLCQIKAVFPDACLEPALPALPGFDQPHERDTALTELLRARLSGFGPLTLAQAATPLGCALSDCEQALARLEAEGYVLRGQFNPGERAVQWCERHLLARIHRYTVKRLRREIEPVSLQDFMRFLFDWQHLAGEERLRGPQAVGEVLGQLQGFPAAAGTWEADLLPARIKDYSPHWLDDACRSGQWAWSRLAASASASTLTSTPLVLLPREQLGLWRSLAPTPNPEQLSPRGQRVLQSLQAHGALFFDELTHEAHLLPSELETALQELVGFGLASADGFSGLRSLITPAAKRASRSSRRGHSPLSSAMAHAGRWALLRRAGSEVDNDLRLEHIARSLLRRYGVVCWRLLERESDVLPSWRELLQCYHRLEARGEIRGGRFIAGLAGEQFALPEAIGVLRQVRRREADGALVVVSGCDPLNLVGTLLPGAKVPAVSGNRLLYRDGVAVACRVAGKYQYLVEVSATEQDRWRQHLLRNALPL